MKTTMRMSCSYAVMRIYLLCLIQNHLAHAVAIFDPFSTIAIKKTSTEFAVPRGQIIGTQEAELPLESTTTTTTSRANIWTSFLTVDPAQLIFTMAEYSGTLIAKEFSKDINTLRTVSSAGKAELNLVDKELIIHNVSVSLPREKHKLPALKIGRLCVQWDKYANPSLEIQIDDVDVFVEFTNSLMTRSNWNELHEFGFPPKFWDYGDGEEKAVRFHSIDLTGDMNVILRSRPIKRDLVRFKLNLTDKQSFNNVLRKASQENERSGRRGCTADEITHLLQGYMSETIRRFITEELRKRATGIVGKVDRGLTDNMLKLASDSFAKYTKQIENLEQMKTKLQDFSRTKKWIQHILKHPPKDKRNRSFPITQE